MENSSEKDKLTLAAIFIATYTALVFSIPQILPFTPPVSFLTQIIYLVFVIGGGFIATIFFLYVAFYALELSSTERTVVSFFKIHLEQDQIKNIRGVLFSVGIDAVFTSFSMPFLFLIQKIQPLLAAKIGGWFGFLTSFIIAVTLFWLIGIAARSIFKRLGKPI